MTNIETGMKAVVVQLLDASSLMLDPDSLLIKNRRLGASGKIIAWITEDQSIVWLRHDAGELAAYQQAEVDVCSTAK